MFFLTTGWGRHKSARSLEWFPYANHGAGIFTVTNWVILDKGQWTGSLFWVLDFPTKILHPPWFLHSKFSASWVVASPPEIIFWAQFFTLFVKSELDRKLPTNLHDLPLKDDDLLNFAMENMMIYLWKKMIICQIVPWQTWWFTYERWISTKCCYGKKQCTHETNDDRLNFAMEKHNDLLMKNDGLLNFAMEKLMIYLWTNDDILNFAMENMMIYLYMKNIIIY